MRVVLDVPVERGEDYIRVGRVRFDLCSDCPLDDEEIVIMLLVSALGIGLGDDFEIIEVSE